MFCNSTGNQTINIIPAIQFGIKCAVLISTEHAEKRGWTKRLINLMTKRGINASTENISGNEEKNPQAMSEKLTMVSKQYERVVWNISGGQKIPSIAFHNAFQKRIDAAFSDDRILYVEGNDPAIWYYGKDLDCKSERIDTGLTMVEILMLYSSEPIEKTELYPEASPETLEKLKVGRKALKCYSKNEYFREAFFRTMSPPDELPRTVKDLREYIRKEILNDVKPCLKDLGIKKTGYEGLEKNLTSIIDKINTGKDITEIKELARKIKIIGNPVDIYNSYWDSIKNRALDMAIERLSSFRHNLFVVGIPKLQDIKQLISEVKSIGGVVETSDGKIFYKEDIKSFSSIGRNGFLFEWMVAASVVDAISNNKQIKGSITDVHCNVKTRRADDQYAKHDSELDIVITAKSGRLIILELKTYEFTGDIAKSKEGSAYKKSGPFGKTVIIGPLLTEMVTVSVDGKKQYPAYIAGKIIEQEDTAYQNGIDYIYLDGIVAKLKKELHTKD
jgi:hypothetical protein